MRILAVDPGSKNIGLAISDPTGTIANPLMILKHISRDRDADMIIEQAISNAAVTIIIGQSVDEEDGSPTFEGRRSARLARTISRKTSLQVELWDESGSTREAKQTRRMMGVSRKKRVGHLDELAATFILQSYLNENSGRNEKQL